MRRAIEAITKKEMGWLKASKKFNVPQATLRRRVEQKNIFITGSQKGLGRFKTSLPREAEDELANLMLEHESRLFGFSTTETRKLAYQLAEIRNYKHSFNRVKKIAGWDWLKGFRKRHPELSLRSPEPTSAARARAFNRVQVNNFFDLLRETMEKENVSSERLYNMDESALTTVQKPLKVFAKKGKKQVGALTSAERGIHVTVVACMGSLGHFVPPALIFPRKNHKPELFDGAPPGTLELCHDTGYMVSDLFGRWMDHFIKYVKPSKEQKVILIVDGHASHKSLGALLKAKENGVIVLCLPPHCTHRLQPLDVAFFGPLEAYYNAEMTLWLKNHPGRTVGLYQISQLFAAAYSKAATIGNALSGYSATGINPFNPNIFPDYLFAPSAPTDIPHNVAILNADTSTSTSRDAKNDVGEEDKRERDEIDEDNIDREVQAEENEKSISECLNILSPLPSVSNTTKLRKRKRKSEGILTKSPYIEEIKAKESIKKQKELRRSERERVTRKIVETEDEDDLGLEEDSDEDVACLFCNDTYKRSRSGESWIRCQHCHSWCHSECAGVPKRVKVYICDVCKP